MHKKLTSEVTPEVMQRAKQVKEEIQKDRAPEGALGGVGQLKFEPSCVIFCWRVSELKVISFGKRCVFVDFIGFCDILCMSHES